MYIAAYMQEHCVALKQMRSAINHLDGEWLPETT